MKFAGLALALAGTAFSQSLTEVLSGNPELSQLGNLVQPYAANLSGYDNITLLAPNNDAIAEFLNSTSANDLIMNPSLVQAVLNYHILQGNYSEFENTTFVPTALQPGRFANVTGGQAVEALPSGDNITFFSGLLQNSSVVNASIPFDGGVVHVIDRFLTLPQNISTTGVALNLTSAVGALMRLNLSDTLDSASDLTVFLPNNDAFQRVGGNLVNLSDSELAEIVSYHVVNGSVLYATDVENGTSFETSGGNVTVTIEGNATYVNNAQVIQPNVLVANGVIHVIDRLLNPSNSTAAPNSATTEEAFPSATAATDQPFTSGVPTPTSSIATESVSEAQASATQSGGAWRPVETGAMGMAALFGGAAAVMNM